MTGGRVDFVVKDEHQVTERSFAALRMTEGKSIQLSYSFEPCLNLIMALANNFYLFGRK